jgi:hypothetical protein
MSRKMPHCRENVGVFWEKNLVRPARAILTAESAGIGFVPIQNSLISHAGEKRNPVNGKSILTGRRSGISSITKRDTKGSPKSECKMFPQYTSKSRR